MHPFLKKLKTLIRVHQEPHHPNSQQLIRETRIFFLSAAVAENFNWRAVMRAIFQVPPQSQVLLYGDPLSKSI